ncbi:MAG: hypothetical protein NZ530_07605 [Thermodesulfobacteriaceae bacterium]|nr:hypothetical protein [Thermodesulfobacteriaceae bacterium]MDW8136512.1 hypothetical protein [Thermodesulfobacterium sp.]
MKIQKFKKKIRTKGSALFLAIVLSTIALILLGSLMLVWWKFTQAAFPVRTYSSLREAAAGGVELLVGYISNRYFDEMGVGRAPRGTRALTSSNAYPFCVEVLLRFQLLGDTRQFNNPVQICYYGIPGGSIPGEMLGGVAYTGPKTGKGEVFALNSTAYGPQNTLAIVEAVYVR